MAEHFDIHNILKQDTTQDSVARILLTHKQIVVMILREYFPEFNGVPLDFIRDKCLDGLEEVDYLIGDRTHGSSGTDMDVCIHARIPKDMESQVGVIINMEIQKKFNPGYDIIKRGIYYACDLIAMEKETVFTDCDYDGLKKVYSIWVCLGAPEEKANQVIRYGMAELCQADETRSIHQAGAAYDLLEIMMICLNDKCQEGGDSVIDMLRTLFSMKLSQEQKNKILEEKYSITFTKEKQMKFNEYIEYVKETCLEIGEEKGFQKGEQSGFQKGEQSGFQKGEQSGFQKGEQKGKKEGKEEGFQLGEAQTRMAVVKNMLHQGKSKKDIQIALGLTTSQVSELIRNVQNNAQA